ncbi:hypothetical protein GCM10012275_19260 [Longimycelium tulufanense]|uniref:Uncharacterized protein n=1 Tax=Longimycelium tulufanense TaxID=907463 RepID=A0A8J3CCQ4_9PSEU|nr:HK97 gp10 family phage protein [Longimycelium tulufanense]GGM48441.1 hypothetical protein GCM10012275_19260 [Longimycelium tulufanense]
MAGLGDGLGFRVYVDGAKRVARAARRLGDKGLQRALRRAHRATANVVVPVARQQAPKRSGRLARSVRAASSTAGAVVSAGRGGRSAVPYAGPIHFGWRKRGIRANRFLYRAAARTKRRYTEVYETEMREVARRAFDTH